MALKVKQFLVEDVDTYFDSMIATIENLVPAGEQTPDSMKKNLQNMLDQASTIFVVIDDDEWVVGTITVLVEQKLTRWWAKAAHIEEIIVRKWSQGQGIGTMLVQQAIDFAREQWCYKIIWDTRDELVPRFEKFGFDSPERMIRKYLD